MNLKTSRISLAIATSLLALSYGPAQAGSSSASGDRFVLTSSGRLLCPSTAFSNGSLDFTKCTKAPTTTTGTNTGATSGATSGSSTSHGDDDDDDRATVCLRPAASATTRSTTDTSATTGSTSTSDTTGGTSGATATSGTGTTADTTTTTTTTATNCAIPTPLRDTKPLAKTPGQCPKGGTRTVTGGYDAEAGTLDVTITFKDCIDAKGAKHNGSAVMQGTLKLTSGSLYALNETKTVLDNVTYENGGTLVRSCKLSRAGEYNYETKLFKGKSTRDDCSLEGEYRFRGGIVDNLIENASDAEEF
jgi:hypothetical protein